MNALDWDAKEAVKKTVAKIKVEWGAVRITILAKG